MSAVALPRRTRNGPTVAKKYSPIGGIITGWLFVFVLTPRAPSQIVQLPTFRFFHIDTSVMAPDRGGSYLGGVRRSASGRANLGTPLSGPFFANRSTGHSRSATGSSAHVTVIDHGAWEASLFDGIFSSTSRHPRAPGHPGHRWIATSLKPGGTDAADARPDAASSTAGSIDSMGTTRRLANVRAGTMSLSEIRQAQAGQRAHEMADARKWFARGRQAESDGKLGAARAYYRLAARKADPDLQAQIDGRLRRLQTVSGTTKGGR